MLLLSVDFYHIKNIAGRRLVGLRWWNEVNQSTGDTTMVFESVDPTVRTINPTDRRFFWLALYAQPVLWVGMALLAIVNLRFIWLSLVGKFALCARSRKGVAGLTSVDGVVMALVLTITNAVAFSRCDKFSQASNMAGSALYSGGLARNIAGGLASRFFTR